MRFDLLLTAGAIAASLSAQTQLTSSSGGGERQPVINADGNIVAYVALVGGVREVFTVPAYGGGAAVRRTTNAEVRIGGTTVFDAWPSLSISDDGNRIAYWNAAGVHVLDLTAASDTLVATASLMPYPQISGDGTRVVYQNLVAGNHEVFVVAATGGAATQVTTASGAGRRLPHVRGDRVVFQRPVGGFQEVFVHNLTTNVTTGPLSLTSGRGNRYARLTHDAARVVYEALVNPGAIKEVFAYDLAAATRRQVTTGSLRGDRLAAPTEDGEAFYELSVVNREVQRIDLASSALAPVTSGTNAGYRRVSVDRHGTIAVYQAQGGNTTEVFARALCFVPRLSNFGQHGIPSTGVLQEADDVYRCDVVLALDTSLPLGTPSVLFLDGRQQAVPIPGAPGNFLYTHTLLAVPLVLNAAGTASWTYANSPFLYGVPVFAQFAVRDPAANALGWVTSKGIRADLR